jgi:phosphohistidine phosphatase
MAAKLWLLRHGEAEPHGARPDPERRLTERGEEQARAAGRALKALAMPFQQIYTSPKVRARDTAILAAAELGLGLEPIEHAPLAEGFDAEEARTLALAGGEEARVLLVGHNPDFVQVIHDLTGGRVDLKKGGLAGMRLEGSRGDLIALLRPRELDRIR